MENILSSFTKVLIDHNTTAGFESIAQAREYLLNVGKKEFADPATENWPIKGSHIVAPVRSYSLPG